MFAPDSIAIECRECGRETREPVAVLAANPVVSCNCGAEFDTSDLLGAVARSLEAGERHEEALRRLESARRAKEGG